jgi:citrate synthase
MNETTISRENIRLDQSRAGRVDTLRVVSAKNTTILDPGLQNTAICVSNVGRIDPEIPKITYREHDLRGLAEDPNFAATACLLISEDSDASAASEFDRQVVSEALTVLPTARSLRALFPNAPVTSIASAMVVAVTPSEQSSHEAVARAVGSIVSSIIAHVDPNGDNSHAITSLSPPASVVDLLLLGCFGSSVRDGADLALSRFLVLHAEHGMNCSTAVVRAVASAGSTSFEAVAAGISAFSGPLHGGASSIVGRVLEQLLESGEDPRRYLQRKIANKERVHGFGHRIYRTEDPRAAFMREILESYGGDVSPHEKIALNLAYASKEIEMFVQHGICPNPDLYNGLLLRRSGFTSEANTAMLCLSRSVGWLAHYYDSVAAGAPLLRPKELSR